MLTVNGHHFTSRIKHYIFLRIYKVKNYEFVFTHLWRNFHVKVIKILGDNIYSLNACRQMSLVNASFWSFLGYSSAPCHGSFKTA
jgi:hypothetical protein